MDNYNDSIGIVINNQTEEDSSPFCPDCEEIGKVSRLKERIYLDDVGKLLPPPPDNDDWLQCWKCGLIVPAFEVKREGKIEGISGVEVIDNPFDFGKRVITGLDSRKKEGRLKQRKKKEKEHPDKDIQKYLNDGWELQSYSSTMPI